MFLDVKRYTIIYIVGVDSNCMLINNCNIFCRLLHFLRFDVQSYWLNKLSFSLIINIAHTLLKIAISMNLLQNLQPNHIPDTTTMGNS